MASDAVPYRIFWKRANALPGILITFAVHNAVQSLFVRSGRLDPDTLPIEHLRTLPAVVAEKFMRVIHVLGLLIAGLSGPGQDVLWATDEDAIAANAERVRQLVDALGVVTSNLLPHGMGHLRLATAKQDKGDLSLEDLLSIPDIAAGALSAEVEEMLGNNVVPAGGFYLAPPSQVADKTKRVMDWFADNTQPLRRLVLVIDEVPDTKHLRATHLKFHGLRDAYGGP
jgi:hypothetical protein